MFFPRRKLVPLQPANATISLGSGIPERCWGTQQSTECLLSPCPSLPILMRLAALCGQAATQHKPDDAAGKKEWAWIPPRCRYRVVGCPMWHLATVPLYNAYIVCLHLETGDGDVGICCQTYRCTLSGFNRRAMPLWTIIIFRFLLFIHQSSSSISLQES